MEKRFNTLLLGDYHYKRKINLIPKQISKDIISTMYRIRTASYRQYHRKGQFIS